MPYPATVHNVFIASPGDVRPERQVARQVISAWNAVHSEAEGAILEAIGWDTHAYPEMGERPQGIINRLVVKSDILVAIFWARLGSPTGVASSGTVEEIENHLKSNRPTMIYFSNAPVPHDVDTTQLENVRAFRRKYESEGLIGTFTSSEDFRTVFTQDLSARMVEYLKSQPPQGRSETISTAASGSALSRLQPSIASDAIRLLHVAARSQSREILRRNVLGGFQISANGKDFINDGERKTQFWWKAALEELERQQFVDVIGTSGPSGLIYRVTQAGDAFLEDLTEEAKARFTKQNEIFVNVEIVFTTHPNKPQFAFVVRLPQATVENAHIEWNMDYLLLHEIFRDIVTKYALISLNFEDFGALPYNSDVSFFLGNPKSLPKNPEQRSPGNCWVWRL